MSRSQFIAKHGKLFWYTAESRKCDIGDELLVETILNEGTLEDYRELRDLLTPKRLAEIFFSAVGRKRGNYHPEIRNFFTLLLKQYV